LRNRHICKTEKIAEIKEGDILSFLIEAYCFSMANYNSRYKPAEVLWMNGEGHLIRAHEAFEDY
jgi:diaminopimelate decarboxylase